MMGNAATSWYHAPEIIMGWGWAYNSKAVGVWAVGCVLAELLGRKPIFPGSNSQHQLGLMPVSRQASRGDGRKDRVRCRYPRYFFVGRLRCHRATMQGKIARNLTIFVRSLGRSFVTRAQLLRSSEIASRRDETVTTSTAAIGIVVVMPALSFRRGTRALPASAARRARAAE